MQTTSSWWKGNLLCGSYLKKKSHVTPAVNATFRGCVISPESILSPLAAWVLALEAPRLLGTSNVIPCRADSAVYPLRGREIGFQAAEDSRSASRRLERRRASAKEKGSPEFPARARVGQRRERKGEGWERGWGRGKEEKMLITTPIRQYQGKLQVSGWHLST